jgi:hypothetical protein
VVKPQEVIIFFFIILILKGSGRTTGREGRRVASKSKGKYGKF